MFDENFVKSLLGVAIVFLVAYIIFTSYCKEKFEINESSRFLNAVYDQVYRNGPEQILLKINNPENNIDEVASKYGLDFYKETGHSEGKVEKSLIFEQLTQDGLYKNSICQ